MRLDHDERRILEGSEGGGRKKAMEILNTLGEIFGAEGLIPITSAQVSGVSYKNLGEPGLEFIRDLAKDCKVTVNTTLNPAGTDLENWQAMGVDRAFADSQQKVIMAYASLGITTSCSCTPYHDVNIPKFGNHLAWGESSAVCYVNSVIGARTNREGGPSALAAAIIGKTPEYGLHLDENRWPELMLDVDPGITDIPALGYHIGSLIDDKVSYIKGIQPSKHELKSFCAALAASGAVALFHLEGITPEAREARASIEGRGIETIEVSKEDVLATARSLTITDEDVELVALGCPHISPQGLKTIAGVLKDKVPKEDGPKLWVCTSRISKRSAPEAVKIIERFGIVLSDTCMVVSPIEGLFKVTATNSAKAAHYLAMDKYGNQKVRYGTLEELLGLLYR